MANVLILDSLPIFSGNPRPGDRKGVAHSHVDVKTFFRSLDNHFAQENITSDERKLRILHSRLCKEAGDASANFSSYSGRRISYTRVRDEFLLLYAEQRRNDFRTLAGQLMATKIQDQTITTDIRRLEDLTRAITESYLSRPEVNRAGLRLGLRIGEGVRNRPIQQEIVREVVREVAREEAREEEEAAAGEEEVEEEENEVDEVEIVEEDGVTIEDAYQHLLMHLFVGPHVPHESYEKVKRIGPLIGPTMFKAKIVHRLETISLMKANKLNKDHEKGEVIFQTTEYNRNKVDNSDRGRGGNNPNPEKESRKCHACGKPGHLKAQCFVWCIYCSRKGHWTAKCNKRIEAQVKYCRNCKSLGHDDEACWKPKRDKPVKKGKGNYNKETVRMVTDMENPDVEASDSDGDQSA